jgi:phosphatidylglycerol:prolipoprotein diacylglycerol transferase
MIAYPHIDPVLVQLGPFAVRWYGMMYTLAFVLGWPLVKARARRWMPEMTPDHLADLILWILIGLVLGGRIGYVIFYQGAYYLDNPAAILRIWQGGMSFHGGLLGGILLPWVVFVRPNGFAPRAVADLVVPVVPLGLMLGRIGNFINAELWGRTTDVPWGMVFPGGGPLPRHPSQLYEAALEGMLLFVVLWWLGRVARPPGFLTGAFFIGYAACRFFVEFFREPDAHLGLLAMNLSMGQWLTLPMVLIGLVLILTAPKKVPVTDAPLQAS